MITIVSMNAHDQSHDGRAYLAHEEMGAFFGLVQKRQLEGNAERQLYCRLYDGGRWTASTGRNTMLIK